MTPKELAVAKAIHRVLPQRDVKDDYFILMSPKRMGHVGPPDKVGRFVFADGDIKPLVVECEDGAILRIYQPVRAAFSAARCSASKVTAAVEAAPRALKFFGDYAASSLKIDSAQARKWGLYYAERTLADGARTYYVPLLGGGHGFGLLDNVILIQGKNAWIISANLEPFCAKFSGGPRPDRLCTDTEEVMFAIAAELRTALPAP